MPPDQSWADYYRAVAQRPPRELYRQAVARFDPASAGSRLAIDLGCGAGIEAADLLARGWRVVAIDQEPAALEALQARVPAEQRARLDPQVATFEQAELPPADFIWAGLSLPFCPPEAFPAVWGKIVAALQPGGRFAGDLFGVRCERQGWADEQDLTLLTREQVTALLAPLHIEDLNEEEGERPTALAGQRHWHGFSVVARRP